MSTTRHSLFSQLPLYAPRMSGNAKSGWIAHTDIEHLYWDRDACQQEVNRRPLGWEVATIYAYGKGSILTIPDPPTDLPVPLLLIDSVLAEIHAERLRAHNTHWPESLETHGWRSPSWPSVLGEELGEIHRTANEHRHNHDDDLYKTDLREELIQLAAMCTAWIAAIDNNSLQDPSHTMPHPHPPSHPKPDTPTTHPPTESWSCYDERIDAALEEWEVSVRRGHGRPFPEIRRSRWDKFVEAARRAGIRVRLEEEL